MLEGQV